MNSSSWKREERTELLAACRITDAKKNIFAAQLLWAVGNLLIKLSFLDLFSKIFWTRRIHIACLVLAALSLCLCVVIILQACLICKPISYQWDSTIQGSCGHQIAGFMAQAIVNLIFDVMMVSLPIPVFWSLQMPWSKRLSIAIMFSIEYW